MKVDAPQYGLPAVQETGHANGMSGEQNSVLSLVSACTDESGISVTELVDQLRSRMSESAVRNALDFLCSEGHIYSTIDDDHFCSTES
jgi:replication factor A2